MEYPGKSKGSLLVGIQHGGENVGAFSTAAPSPMQTGSEGYLVSGKFTGKDGFVYQFTGNATRVHSKDEPEAPKRAEVASLLAKQKAAARAAKTATGKARK